MSEQDVVDTFEVIAGLEGQSGELAAERITAAEQAEIRALHYEMLAAHTRRDLPTYYRLNAQIHDLINAAARNPVLTQTYRTINARLQALRFRSNFDTAKWEHAVAEHEQMIERLAARDGAGLRAVLIAHLEHKRDAVLDLMREAQPAPARPGAAHERAVAAAGAARAAVAGPTARACASRPTSPAGCGARDQRRGRFRQRRARPLRHRRLDLPGHAGGRLRAAHDRRRGRGDRHRRDPWRRRCVPRGGGTSQCGQTVGAAW